MHTQTFSCFFELLVSSACASPVETSEDWCQIWLWDTVASAALAALHGRTEVEVRSSRFPHDIHRHSPLSELCRQEWTTCWWVEPVLSHAGGSLCRCYKIRWERLWFDFWLSMPRGVPARADIQRSYLLGFPYWSFQVYYYLKSLNSNSILFYLNLIFAPPFIFVRLCVVQNTPFIRWIVFICNLLGYLPSFTLQGVRGASLSAFLSGLERHMYFCSCFLKGSKARLKKNYTELLSKCQIISTFFFFFNCSFDCLSVFVFAWWQHVRDRCCIDYICFILGQCIHIFHYPGKGIHRNGRCHNDTQFSVAED